MKKVPDDLYAGRASSTGLGLEAREIVLVRLCLDKVPPEAVAGRPHSEIEQAGIIFLGKLIVPGRGDQIQTASGPDTVRRAFEPAHKKTLEWNFRHKMSERSDQMKLTVEEKNG